METEKYTELAVKLQEIESRCKSNEYRIGELCEDMEKMQETQITLVKLANGVDKIADQLVDMKSDIKEVKVSQKDLSNKVNTLENRPANEIKKRWDSLSDKLLWLLISGMAGFLLSQAFSLPF